MPRLTRKVNAPKPCAGAYHFAKRMVSVQSKVGLNAWLLKLLIFLKFQDISIFGVQTDSSVFTLSSSSFLDDFYLDSPCSPVSSVEHKFYFGIHGLSV